MMALSFSRVFGLSKVINGYSGQDSVPKEGIVKACFSSGGGGLLSG